MKVFKQPEIKDLALRFTRCAWGKLVYVNELSTTEISGFCIANANDLLLVEDIAFLQQVNTGASTLLDDEAVANHFDDQVDAGRKPAQFARIWLHTHPGAKFVNKTGRNRRITNINDDLLVPSPSWIDENTISRVFGNCDWAVMFIYGGGSTGYARLSLKKPMDGQIILPVKIQKKGKNPTKKDFIKWKQEFEKNITAKKWNVPAVELDLSLTPGLYLQLLEILDADIDADDFARFVESRGQTVKWFCELDASYHRWWLEEFRREQEVKIINPYC